MCFPLMIRLMCLLNLIKFFKVKWSVTMSKVYEKNSLMQSRDMVLWLDKINIWVNFIVLFFIISSYAGILASQVSCKFLLHLWAIARGSNWQKVLEQAKQRTMAVQICRGTFLCNVVPFAMLFRQKWLSIQCLTDLIYTLPPRPSNMGC